MGIAVNEIQDQTGPSDQIEVLAMAAGICKAAKDGGSLRCRLCSLDMGCAHAAHFIDTAFEALNYSRDIGGK